MGLSREKVNYLSQVLTKGLADVPGVTLQAPENTVRLEIVRAIFDAPQARRCHRCGGTAHPELLYPQNCRGQPRVGRDVPEALR